MKRPILEQDSRARPSEHELSTILALLNGNQTALNGLALIIRQCRCLRPAYVAAKETPTETRKEAADLLAALRMIAKIAESSGDAWEGFLSELDEIEAGTQLRLPSKLFSEYFVDHLIQAAESNAISLKSAAGRPEKPDGFVREMLMSGMAHAAQLAGVKVTKYPNSPFFRIAEIAYPLAGFFIDPTNDIDAYMKKSM